MALKHEEPDRHGVVSPLTQGVVAVDELVGGEAVAFGFGHFPAVHREHVAVHPVAHRTRGAEGAHVLGDFAFVVGELQVHPATVDIKLLTEVLRTHRRTLQMPPRKAHAPR